MAYDFLKFTSSAQQALTHAKKEFSKLRTGRASVQILDPVKVEAYGTLLSIQELASIVIADPTLLVVKPYDKSQLEAIAKGIQNADLNLNPVVDGESIKLAIPQLTAERRQELVKLLHAQVEEIKVRLRSIRGEIKQEIEAQEGISEDDIKRDLAELDKKFQAQVSELEAMADAKEKELTTI